MTACFVVAVLDRFGSTPCGTFTTPGTALAFLEKRRAEWPALTHGVYDCDAPEAGDCEARLRAEWSMPEEGLWLIERTAGDIARHYKRAATEDDIA